ncbi:MAG: response regulator transcription factor [Myxococcales bacterium]|nr:response regulator transcription factor [Myxococcales bacterium]MCB9645916.1 response regulator transcription factor [Deltaproteobacteria bacterium]
MKVLVAEDDPHMRRGIEEILEGEGYQVVAVADGEAAVEAYRSHAPDFVCLDIMMPKLNGYDVCRVIRRSSATVPIMFLSAKSEEVDKVLGLELGADDYVMKPFGVKEFAARVRAICRRALRTAPAHEVSQFILHDLTVLPAELRARRGDQLVELSLREVRLLRCFFEHPGQALDRDRLFAAGWGHKAYPNSRTLDQHISKLRKKVELDPTSPRIIQTVHGLGYRYEPTGL